jgi:hypothetical protein
MRFFSILTQGCEIMFSVLLRYDTILFYIENEIENNTLSVVFTQGTGNAVLFCIS